MNFDEELRKLEELAARPNYREETATVGEILSQLRQLEICRDWPSDGFTQDHARRLAAIKQQIGKLPSPARSSPPRAVSGQARKELPAPVDIRGHAQETVALIQTLVGKSLSYQSSEFDSLASEIRKLVYTLTNHIRLLARRDSGAVTHGDLYAVRDLLAQLGVEEWTPDERVAWCGQCGYEPLYTRVHDHCEYCTLMICPNCRTCGRGRKCGSQRQSGEPVPEIPF